MLQYLFIDAIIFAFRLSTIRYAEQLKSILYAAENTKEENRPIDDAIFSFLQTLQAFGFGPQNPTYQAMERFLAAPDVWRVQYAGFFLIPSITKEPTPSFLTDQRVTFLVEPLLTFSQREQFAQDFWAFKRNHSEQFLSSGQSGVSPQMQVGIYAHEPTDNESILNHFEEYFSHLCHHTNQKIRKKYQDFPLEFILLLLRRTYTPQTSKTGNNS